MGIIFKNVVMYKGNLPALQSVKDFVELRQGKSAGAVLALYEIARRLGI